MQPQLTPLVEIRMGELGLYLVSNVVGAKCHFGLLELPLGLILVLRQKWSREVVYVNI